MLRHHLVAVGRPSLSISGAQHACEPVIAAPALMAVQGPPGSSRGPQGRRRHRRRGLIFGKLTLTHLRRKLRSAAFARHSIKRVDRLLGNRHLHEVPGALRLKSGDADRV